MKRNNEAAGCLLVILVAAILAAVLLLNTLVFKLAWNDLTPFDHFRRIDFSHAFVPTLFLTALFGRGQASATVNRKK